MMQLYPEQLAANLQDRLRGCYLLCGDEPLLLQESQDAIRQAASRHQFAEHSSFVIDAHTDWSEIFAQTQALSLFSSRQILALQLPDNGISSALAEKLQKLATLLHNDILLIIRINKLNQAQKNSAWFNTLSPNGVYVNCVAPDHNKLPLWVSRRAKAMQLQPDSPTIQLLCYCYEGNLLALVQTLQRLSLLYPDGKLTLPRVEPAVNDAAQFNAFHWVDALLASKSKRAWHVLQQLRLTDAEPLILLRTIQRDLLLLLQLQHQQKQVPLKTLFDSHRVWQNRRPLFDNALQRLSMTQITHAIQLLASLEIKLKQDYGQSIWEGLEQLSVTLCTGASLPTLPFVTPSFATSLSLAKAPR